MRNAPELPRVLASGLALLLSLAAAPATRAAGGRPLLPPSEEYRLPNGLRVFLVPNREVPLVSFQVRILGGSLEDPAGKEGTATVLAALLEKGAGERDATAFQEAVDQAGGRLATAASHRWISLRSEFLSEDVDLALELLSDALRRPRLEAGEFEKERGLATDAVRQRREQPGQVIGTYFLSWLFPGHGFARPSGGDERSLAALGREDVLALARRQLAPARTMLAVAGDFDPAAMKARLAARFSDWPDASPPPAPPPKPAAVAKSRVLLVDKPDSLQTYFRLGDLGIDWSHPDYPARQLANTILGGRFTSRLNSALRIESGLTYGAFSSFDDLRAGAFQVGSYTATKTSREAIELALAVHRKFVEEGITQAELDSARAYIQGQYAPENVETAEQVAGLVLALACDGLEKKVVDELFPRLDALDLATVNRVIREHFPARALAWVIVGRAEAVRPVAAALGEVTEVPLSGPGFGPGFP